MRVISGIAKGKKLLNIKTSAIRPTENRVKEAMFSIIQLKIQNAVVLDLFAGSGQLSIEALSRGAKFCTLVDYSFKATAIQKANLKLTGFYNNSKIIHSDCLKFLESSQNEFDFIFLDPPFKSNLMIKTLKLVANKIKKDGSIICEHDHSIQMPSNFYNIELQKQYSYGKIKLTLYGLKN